MGTGILNKYEVSMKLPDRPVTERELQRLIDSYIADECERNGSLTHKKCGSQIQTGFVKICVNGSETTRKVPYCKNCEKELRIGFNSVFSEKIIIEQN